MTIAFPGTWNPPVTLDWWEQLPRIELPSGGSLVVDLPTGESAPIDLNSGAGLTVDIPAWSTQTFWFVEEYAVAWWAWY